MATTLATAGTELAVADAAQAVAEGVVLGGYQYLEYKGNATPSKLKKVTVLAAGGAPVRAAVERGVTIADAVTWARDLVNRPANEKSPSDMAADARKLLRGTGRHGAGARREAAAGRSAWVVSSASARARSQAPRFLKMTYAPSARARQAARVRGQGRRVRLRWSLAQDLGRHGDDEDRHVAAARR